VLLELRANPATAYIPFIFVTARASYEDVRQGMDLGADDYITKPFTRLELLQAIQTRLAKKTIQQNLYQQQVEEWRQAFEEEREQRQLKSKLVAMFSHDFRNPLASIMSSNSLLRDYADRMDDERRLIHFDRIETSVRQLLQMLDDMLIVAQMETGNLRFTPEALNIDHFLQKIVEEFQTIYGETHPIIYESQVNETIMADTRLLRQVTSNLLANAIKYSPHGSEILVKLERQKHQIMLTVCDHGIGIPEADQANLFTAFHRASNVGEVHGTGLGLAIVKQAIDLHKGSIDVVSEVGSGTSVTVGIPVQ
jgi:two-component system, sensor histidine kinase and response regulator